MRHFFPNKRISLVVCLCFAIALAFYSCNSTKYVPEGKYMLNKVAIQVDDENINKEELKNQVRQNGNLRILGIVKFHLGIYNLSSKKRENDWLKRIGEAPVIYEEYQTQRSTGQLRVYLNNKGYYNAIIRDTLIKSPSKPKLDQVFFIKANSPYTIRKFSYQIEDPGLQGLILSDSVNNRIKPNLVFDVDVLNAERTRIARYLKNHGFFNFTEDHIRFLADSTLNSRQIDLTLRIEDSDSNSKALEPHKRYRVGNYTVNADFVAPYSSTNPNVKPLELKADSNYTFLYRSKLNYTPRLFKDLNRIPDSTYYCLDNVDKTYRALNRLRQFKVININFTENKTDLNTKEPLLDCNFQLSPLPRQGISVEVEGTNSSGNLGIAGNLNIQHRNVFHGAEVFDFQIRGAMERQQAMVNQSQLDFNTRELGIETGLTIPKFLSPVGNKHMFSFQIPQTKLSLGYNYQRRPDYTRTITTLRFGYIWKSSEFVSQALNLLDINYVNLYEFNEDFINSIKDLYIKSSFTDHLVSGLNYSRTYNTQNLNRRENYKFFKVSFESAGNLLSAWSNIINKEKTIAQDTTSNTTIKYYEFLNTRFAQFVKADFEYRYGQIIDKYNSVVGRAFVGVGLPYGNLDMLPFEKKYFSGGANSIRAWQVRSLGPGNYVAPAGVYPNQSSDIKLEANLEYRFKFIQMIEGALFLDAGNIWAIKAKDNREGAVFKVNNFYKQIAVGTGFGLRFDFTYFLFRLDLGMKLRDPSLEEGVRWILGNYKLDADKFNLSFAIGYPF